MAVFEERNGKDGSIKYRAKVRIKGHPALSNTFRRLTDAKRWAQKIETEIQEGSYLPKAQARKYTLAELIDRFLAESLPSKSAAMQEIQTPQLRWWKKQIGPYLLSDITPALIIEQRSKLERGTVQGGNTRSLSSCNRYVAALRHAFTIASRDWEWMQDNPAKRVVKLGEPSGRIRCLDSGERQRLLTACKASRSPFLFPIVLIALSNGMRYNEIRTLTWKQISFSEGVILLFQTKNKRPRRVPLQGEALRVLKEHSKVRRIDTDLLFPSPTNPKTPADIRDAWDHAVIGAKLESFRFHDLRHTAASYYAMSGATARDLCDIFGWETMQMAMRYAHLFDSHTTELAARMSEKFLENKSQLA